MVKNTHVIEKLLKEAAKKKDDLDVKKVSTSKAVKIDALKGKKYNIPSSSKGNKFEEFVKICIKNMSLMEKGFAKSSLQLQSQPGMGKTSALVQLSILFGMELFIIEGSALTEDQFVEIPYIMFRNGKKTEKVAKYKQEDDNQYTLVNAESALANVISKLKIIPEKQWMQSINQNKNLKYIFDKYEKFIRAVRMEKISSKSGFKGILLLDEYLRTGSKKVTNLLRTILNGKIGNTDIPKGIWIITATNTDNSDGSLDTINLNQQFQTIDFDTDFKPSTDDFFRYMANKYTPDDTADGVANDETKQVIIKSEIYNEFEKVVTDKDTSIVSNGVRLSPRRLEQMMLFINDRMPVENKTQAGAVLKYIEEQFTDPETDEKSDLLSKYLNMAKDIIKQTSGITDVSPLPDTQWKETLSEQLDAKLNIGPDKSYPIVLSGMPGTSKTTALVDIAKNKNLGLIDIDASTLTIDDTVGVTIPKEHDDGTIETVFSKPPLYVKIMTEYNTQKEKLIENGISKAEQNKRKYNVILMIDELNRTEKDIFNKLRILLLEKKVGTADYALPKDIMILSAMNPNSEGTVEMPEHFKDVLDTVKVKLSIKDVETYLTGLSIFDNETSALGFNISKLALSVLKNIYDRFKSDTDIDDNTIYDINVQPFYWNTGNTVIYVSAREISDMYQQIIENVSLEFEMNNYDAYSVTDENIKKYINTAKNETYTAIKNMLSFIFLKQEVEKPDANKFLKVISDIIKLSPIFESVIFKKENESLNNMSFSSIIAGNNYDINKVIKDGMPYVEQWLKSLPDFSDAASDLLTVYTYAFETYKIPKLLQFMIDIIKLFKAVDWKDIPGGNGIKDKLYNSFHDKLTAILQRSDYIDALLEYSEVENLTDELKQTVLDFKKS